MRDRWAGLALVERLIVVVLGGLFLLDLLVALVAPPNNYDSQTYHLPKIEHWVQQGHVGFYPTIIDRQLAMAPGAEYLLLHLRLLTGGDGFYNLVQLAAGVGVVLAASRIAGQLGGGTRAQLVTALIVGTTPMIVLEATSTQTDLVVALWVACVATFTLDGLRSRSGALDTLLIGVAAGLTLLTKATGLLGAGLLLLVWIVAQLRLRWWRGLLAALATGGLMLLLAGPSLLRVQETYDNPLGPAHLRESISMQRHDPASVLVNGLRIAETALQTPIGPLNHALSAGIIGIAGVLGVDPQARDITYWNEQYPYTSWPPDEDRVSLPAQGVLILLGALLLAFRNGTRLYAGVFWLALLAYVVTVKWQPWGNRLIVFLLVLGAPLAGLWIASLTGRRLLSWVTTGALVAGVAAGGFTVAYGWPRRLVGPGSIFTTSQLEQRFLREPQWQRDYEWAAAAVRASGARRVGLAQGYNTWEYPWWILLPGTEIVSLQSLQPNLPAAPNTTIDAMLCVKPVRPCEFYTSPTWQNAEVHHQGDVAYVIVRRQ
ncbi:ArnT family glycosyltransferase [Dactylosporangium sp. NPDC000521]|uniref:ArnT family glycosyltransferase n=1 Tax=Dactylosporangium sp. NPDC000521 TaxID=3363975 RepID=UPI0036C27CC8